MSEKLDPTKIKAARDVWQTLDGSITLLRGDSLEILPELPTAFVDAVITDPPYSSGGAFRGDRMISTRAKYVQTDAQHEISGFTGDNRDQRAYLAWTSLWSLACLNVTRPGALVAVFTDWRQLPVTTDAIQAGGWVWRGVATWQKTTSRPMLGRFTNQCEFVVWGTDGPREIAGSTAPGWLICDIDRGDDRLHITQKPVPVMEWLIKPTQPGDLVLDPFAGSGTTGVACIRTGRRFVGIEKTPEHFATAIDRIGKEIERLSLLEKPTKLVQRTLGDDDRAAA